MSTLHFNQTTTSTPEQFIAGLTDFGPGRETLFGNSASDYLKVHSRGLDQADVTEGSGGVARNDGASPGDSRTDDGDGDGDVLKIARVER